MIWSDYCNNWVMTIKECNEALDKRRLEGGDLHPDYIRKELEELEW